MNLLIDLRNTAEQFRIVEQRRFLNSRFELVHKLDQPSRAVDQRHPDLGTDLLWRWSHRW